MIGTKKANFGLKEQDLISEIEKFKKAQKINSFSEAVRELCKTGLHMSNAINTLKR